MDTKTDTNAPGADLHSTVMAPLATPLAAELLKACVDGKDPLTFPRLGAGVRDSVKKRTLKMLSEQILAVSGINISFQWKNTFLPPTPLTSKLVYPGDFYPDNKDVSTYFCKQNWPVLLERLRNDQHTIQPKLDAICEPVD